LIAIALTLCSAVKFTPVHAPGFQGAANKLLSHRETSMQQSVGESCPPRMSDGRSFTQYIPGCELIGPNMSSNQSRAHLMANADALMKRNRELAFNNGCTMTCFDPATTSGTALPELNYMSCNNRTCEIVPGVQAGLGMGRKAKSVPGP
jgi:hypothetical protein